MIKNFTFYNQINKNGFTKFQFLDNENVNKLIKIYDYYQKNHTSLNESFKGTSWINDNELKLSVSRETISVVEPFIEKHFQNYRIIGATYLLKNKADQKSKVDFHQDWTYVDEKKYFSMNVWVALEDIDKEKGGLFFVPKTHRFGNYIRSAPSYPIPFKKIFKSLEKLKKSVEVKAGECICFNNKIIHGSFPNLINSDRLVLVFTLIPNEAKLIHHYIENPKKPNELTQYTLDNETFMTLERSKPPSKYLKKEKLNTEYPDYTSLSFLAHLFWLNIIDLFRKY